MRLQAVLTVFLLAASVFLGAWSRPAAAAASGQCLPARQLPVTVLVRSGEQQPFAALSPDDPSPFIDAATGRTIVPLRALTTALNPGTNSVRWYDDLQTATFWHGGHSLSIRFPRGADRTYSAVLDQKPISLTSYLCNGRVWVTARSVAEAFGIDIQYYENGIVLIDGAGKDPWHNLTTGRTSQCTGFPASAAEYIWSPFASYRKAATAVACQLVAK
jgi:hypothetical protein